MLLAIYSVVLHTGACVLEQQLGSSILPVATNVEGTFDDVKYENRSSWEAIKVGHSRGCSKY